MPTRDKYDLPPIGTDANRIHVRIVVECEFAWFAVLDWNEPSIAFYNALGAVPLGDWTTYRLDEAAIAEIAG